MSSNDNIHWGEELRRFVDSTRLKYKDVADRAGMSAQTLSNTFTNKTVLLDTIVRICHACDSRAYWFIASVELPKMPTDALKIMEEIFFLPQKKREFFLRQMIEIKKLMDEIEKEANNK